jgi:hypothetical protein
LPETEWDGHRLKGSRSRTRVRFNQHRLGQICEVSET